MGVDRGDLVYELVAEIMLYLQSNPDASDSLLGIRDWWLKNCPATQGLGALNEALEILVRARVLQRFLLPGDEYVFRVSKHAALLIARNRRCDGKDVYLNMMNIWACRQ